MDSFSIRSHGNLGQIFVYTVRIAIVDKEEHEDNFDRENASLISKYGFQNENAAYQTKTCKCISKRWIHVWKLIVYRPNLCVIVYE